MQLPFLALGIFSFACGALSSAADAEPPIRRVEPRASHLQDEGFYFNITITGKKVGWMRQQMQKRDFEGESAYAMEVDYTQKILNDGEALTYTSTDTEYFAAKPPHQFLGAISTSAQNGFKSSTKILRSDRGEGQFVAKILGGKKERSKELGTLDYTLGDALAIVVWCEEKPAIGDAIRVRELDFTDLEVRPSRFTVSAVLPAEGEGEGALAIGGLVGRYQMEYFDPVGKVHADFTVDGSGRLLRGDVTGAVELELTTKEEALKLKANIDLFESSLIKIDEPLGDPSDIREMVLEITGEGVDAITDSANQTASYDAEAGRLLLKVGAKHGTGTTVTAEDRAKALEETSVYPTKDAQVIALVDRAIGKATRPKARIKRLVDFVDTFIADDYGNEPLSVNDIIDTQRGDCTEHSQLFVTMARAAGIPAREVSGFIYGEDSTYSFGGHAWCEVEVDGKWHPVDPTWGETMINATHIRISGERPSSEELGLFMGGLKFRMLSVTDRRGKSRVFAKPSKTE